MAQKGKQGEAEREPSSVESGAQRMVSDVVPRGTGARRDARAPSVPGAFPGRLRPDQSIRPQRVALPPTPPDSSARAGSPSEEETAQTIPASAGSAPDSGALLGTSLSAAAPSPAAAPVPEGAWTLSQLPSDHASAPPETQGPLTPLDQALLETLEEAFVQHAGADGQLGTEELQRALGLKSPLLASRLLAVFDRDGDGIVTRSEFVERVRRLLYGSPRDKLRFAFRIHDLDGDHRISRAETETMIRASLSEEGFSDEEQDPRALVDLIFQEADRNRDGSVSYREFETAVEKHPAILEMITRCEACWIAPGRNLLGRRRRLSLRGRTQRFLANRGSVAVVVGLWVALNLALGISAALTYRARGENALVMLARAGGACLNFNGALILVPVMRRLITRVRRQPALQFLPVDDAIAFHRLVGHTMFALALVHTGAHMVNYRVSRLGIASGLLQTSAGLSGLALLGVFCVMWICSLPFVRRTRRFELFYFTHLLYVAWLALCLLHGPVFFLWATVPILGFALEQFLRRTRGAHVTWATEVEPQPSGVTHLVLQRPPGFWAEAGDYAFIKIPALARHEWHPFTISSAPERSEVTMHVRSLGNFTRELGRLAARRKAAGDHSPVPVRLDGPYGTPSAHIFRSRNVILVGAGIGVTPFASVLESLVLRAREGRPGPDKVHFYWLSRDAVSFEWFAELLLELEAMDEKHLVDLHIYMTAGRGNVMATALNLARSIAHRLGKPDLITGLRSKTKLGKPDFAAELGRIRQQHAGEELDLYFCGPPGLGQMIEGACRDHGIRYRQEHF